MTRPITIKCDGKNTVIMDADGDIIPDIRNVKINLDYKEAPTLILEGIMPKAEIEISEGDVTRINTCPYCGHSEEKESKG